MTSSYSTRSFVSSKASVSRASSSSSKISSAKRAISVYGGAGSSGVRMSTSSAQAGFGGYGAVEMSVLGNEKFMMQNLNDRLASYMQKVHALEKANSELELKIRQFLDSKVSPKSRDYAVYMNTIKELQNKILVVINQKAGIYHNISNTTLAIEDFRMKYEYELSSRQTVEADITGLKRLKEDLQWGRKDLTLHLEGLQEELAFLKKNHEEEMLLARQQMSGQVNVEVDSPAQQNLTKVLEEIREHYEAVIAKSRREWETWFKTKTETLNCVVVTHTETLQTSKSETKTLKNKFQSYEIELQSISAMKASLEISLSEVQRRYASRMSSCQMEVTRLEEQLGQLRADLERQSQEYKVLLDIKTRLELEIAEYRRLLDGEATTQVTSTTSKSSRTKVITVVEEVVDGKVISSSSSSSTSISASRI